jgi:hypothetical protein
VRRSGPQYVGGAAIWYLAPDLHATLDGVDGLEAVGASAGVRAADQIIADGTRLEGLRHSFARVGCVRTQAGDADKALDLARDGVQRLSVRSTPS